MSVTWICLLMIMIASFNVYQVHNTEINSKRGIIIKTTKRIKDSLFTQGKLFKNAIKNLPTNLRRFMRWLKKNARKGIQCFRSKSDFIRCQTNGKLHFQMKMATWNLLPKCIKSRWFKTDVSTKVVT
ncbi:uncharacterized protein LOC111030505 [Myzus persicae]|uniref:uncharacterized protein LOC111030505 n=1 Tax=Myzus persicae TaxID=13164 RepID=UPI000B933411|nr:uncharacterized protein LOC111030505 [Myzus persicae]